MDERKFVGKSLSLCVTDILMGVVDVNDVLFINAGTRIDSIESLNGVIDMYMQEDCPWAGFDRDDVLLIVEDLIFNNKLYQSRLYSHGDGSRQGHLRRSVDLHNRRMDGDQLVFDDVWLDVTGLVDSLYMDEPLMMAGNMPSA
tara:strand:- start:258 stop:686 length:429 start_codon:yes stop_codon:yes gene_type:complete